LSRRRRARSGERERLTHGDTKIRADIIPVRQIVIIEVEAPSNAVQRVLGLHHVHVWIFTGSVRASAR